MASPIDENKRAGTSERLSDFQPESPAPSSNQSDFSF